MSAAIIDNRIDGTRITVWDITHYLESGRWTHQQIAEILRLTQEQVETAVQYIQENKEEVWRVHRQIEERHARGNPPEVEARLNESHAQLLAWLEEKKRRNSGEANGEGHLGGR